MALVGSVCSCWPGHVSRCAQSVFPASGPSLPRPVSRGGGLQPDWRGAAPPGGPWLLALPSPILLARERDAGRRRFCREWGGHLHQQFSELIVVGCVDSLVALGGGSRPPRSISSKLRATDRTRGLSDVVG